MKTQTTPTTNHNDRLAVIFKDDRDAFWVNCPEDALLKVQAYEHARVNQAPAGSGWRFARATWQQTTRRLFYGSEHIGWVLPESMMAVVSRAAAMLTKEEAI